MARLETELGVLKVMAGPVRLSACGVFHAIIGAAWQLFDCMCCVVSKVCMLLPCTTRPLEDLTQLLVL
mgnify:CR=1 FL=1